MKMHVIDIPREAK